MTRLRSSTPLRIHLGIALAFAACSDDDPTPAEHDSSATPTSSEGSSTSTSTTSDASSSTQTSEDPDSSSDGPPSPCGNGALDDDEECDDGNAKNGDACSSTCTTQFTVAWERIVDGGMGLDDVAQGLAIADDGSIYVIGTIDADEDASDLWLQQYAPDGTEGWTFVLDGDDALRDEGRGVAVHRSGDLLLTGSTESLASGSDATVIRLATDEQSIVWQDLYDGAHSGDVDGDRGLVVVGDQNGDVLVGGSLRDDADGTSAWLRRYSEDGELYWTLGFVGADGEGDAIEDIAIDAVAVAWVVGAATRSASPVGWLRGIGPGSLLVDERSFVDQPLHGAEITAENTVLMCGEDTQNRADNGLVHRLDDELNTAWLHVYDGPAMMDDQLRHVVEGPSGELYVIGRVAATQGRSDDDAWIARLDSSDGVPIWSDRIDGAGMDDGALAIAVAPTGEIVVAGFVTTEDRGTDIWVRRYDEP